MEDEKILQKAELALDHVLISMPHLVGLVQNIYLQIETRIYTVGIFESGRLIINPNWFGHLNIAEATFVMAHELMHLVLKTHQRQGRTDAQLVNIAHDIIINHSLESKLGMTTPANGLTYRTTLSEYNWWRFQEIENTSLENVIKILLDYGKKNFDQYSWNVPNNRPIKSDLGEALQNALKTTKKDEINPSPQKSKNTESIDNPSDVLTIAEELVMYPEETPKSIREQTAMIQQEAINAIAQDEIFEKVLSALITSKTLGHNSGHSVYNLNALRHHYAPPWHWAMQQWLEATSSSHNTYARPNRRGQYDNFVRPGRYREGFTIHIVLDTSGSMANVLPKLLGIIGSFCEATNIDTVHILQCDTEVTVDEWVETTNLENYAIHGNGGSNMSPAMRKLAEDTEVERIIVLTDGDILFMTETPPYEVLWVLTTQNSYFRPIYGQVIYVDTR